jgi:hypothetical protein
MRHEDAGKNQNLPNKKLLDIVVVVVIAVAVAVAVAVAAVAAVVAGVVVDDVVMVYVRYLCPVCE